MELDTICRIAQIRYRAPKSNLCRISRQTHALVPFPLSNCFDYEYIFLALNVKDRLSIIPRVFNLDTKYIYIRTALHAF